MIELPEPAQLRDFQKYIYELEKLHGWLEVDLIHNCFLMGEEVGELFKAIRKYQKYFNEQADHTPESSRRAEVADELVDVMNYLLALANRLEIDLEAAFRDKNARNQERSWN